MTLPPSQHALDSQKPLTSGPPNPCVQDIPDGEAQLWGFEQEAAVQAGTAWHQEILDADAAGEQAITRLMRLASFAESLSGPFCQSRCLAALQSQRVTSAAEGTEGSEKMQQPLVLLPLAYQILRAADMLHEVRCLHDKKHTLWKSRNAFTLQQKGQTSYWYSTNSFGSPLAGIGIL